jgi:stearoyl-CoA desaturase (delta-9 desaturase)
MAAQRGPLWWAAHHREHHRNSDSPNDVHSPRQHGFLWSHLGWFLAEENLSTDKNKVKDWLRYPELRFLDRYHLLVPVLTATGLFFIGAVCATWLPNSGTSGAQMLVWGFLISTLALYHITYAVNSVAHEFGHRRFITKDDSRNNFVLALLTFGEGWHNNHHRYAVSARQGFYWWEIDVTYYILSGLALLGLVWDLKPVPSHILTEGRRSDAKAPSEEPPGALPIGGDRP